jgi:hypothetical protein
MPDEWRSERQLQHLSLRLTGVGHGRKAKGGHVKKLSGLALPSLCRAAPSFGAERLVTRSAKVVGKDSYQAVAVSAQDAGKAGKAAVRLVL